jgi:hypothetical protein
MNLIFLLLIEIIVSLSLVIWIVILYDVLSSSLPYRITFTEYIICASVHFHCIETIKSQLHN